MPEIKAQLKLMKEQLGVSIFLLHIADKPASTKELNALGQSIIAMCSSCPYFEVPFRQVSDDEVGPAACTGFVEGIEHNESLLKRRALFEANSAKYDTLADEIKENAKCQLELPQKPAI